MPTFLRLTDTTGASILVNAAMIGAIYPTVKVPPARTAISVAGDPDVLYVRESFDVIAAVLVVRGVREDREDRKPPEWTDE